MGLSLKALVFSRIVVNFGVIPVYLEADFILWNFTCTLRLHLEWIDSLSECMSR